MVGGKKRKIEIKKRDSKTQRAVAFSKRRNGLFKKAAELSFATGATMAIFATSPSEKPNVIYSFFSNSTSAYEIADCFLNNKIPSKPEINPKSRFWWEDLEPDCFQDPSLIDYLNQTKNDLMASIARKIQNRSGSLLQNPNFSPLCNQIPNQILNQTPNENRSVPLLQNPTFSPFRNQIPNQIFDQIPNQNQYVPLIQNPNISNQIPDQTPNRIANQISNGGGWPDVLLSGELEEAMEVGEIQCSDEEWWRRLLDDCGEEERRETRNVSLEETTFGV